ncbi:MAG: hypothetical protein MUC38_05715 [Cyclobacteriaceae bacterium]|jgi:biotin carboxyl carrier protein|nr:hypothetical protein [Cyclobacteriaceae bacterium]
MTLNRILTVVLLVASLGLFYKLVRSINGTIEEREAIATKEEAIIERLKLIREAETVFQEVHGRYTANWDSLANFIENGRVAIVEKKEIIEQQAYGGEKITITYDTLGFIAAKERIFKKNFTVNASDNGTFMGFKVNVGEQLIKNQRPYAIKVGDKTNEPPLSEDGTVISFADVKPGDALKKGQILINMWRYQFNPNVDLAKIGFIPGRENQKFDIYVGKVDKSGLKVDVIEVKDPTPDDKTRNERNEAKNRKPLHFGSKVDVSTAGNWE